MRAVCLKEGRATFQASYPNPQPLPGMVRIRVLRAGICETDLQLISGYMGFSGILGHEFVGVAETGRYAGRRVVGEINCCCGVCDFCNLELKTHCPNRTVLGILNHDGAFADVLYLPEENLHVVPENLSNDEAVFTEPVAAALQILQQVDIHDRQTVMILGDGRLGNLCAQVLNRTNCRLRVIGKHREKLALLDDLSIATMCLEEVNTQQIRSEHRIDVVVDCTGSASGFPLALQLVRPRGTIVAKTTVAGTQDVALAPVVIDEVTVIGSRCGPFDEALRSLAAGEIDVEPLIAARFPIERAEEALIRAGQSGVMKVLLDIS